MALMVALGVWFQVYLPSESQTSKVDVHKTNYDVHCELEF
jgi:hypothetical protein